MASVGPGYDDPGPVAKTVATRLGLQPDAFAERERLLSQSTGVAGFEPATTRLTVEGSAAELHAIGGGGRIRTCDFQVMSLASYRTALLRVARIFRFSWELPESNRRHKDFQSFALPSELSPQSGNDWTRTSGLSIISRMLYQLSYVSKWTAGSSLYLPSIRIRKRTGRGNLTRFRALIRFSHIGQQPNDPYGVRTRDLHRDRVA